MAAVLLVNDYWKRNDKSCQTRNQINTTLSQRLHNRGVKTYSTTLALKEDDDDLEHARAKGVIVIQPQPTKRKKSKPEISWLGEYHAIHYPNLPTDVGCIVGYSATTLDVASILKEERYPDSKLVVINTIKPQQAEEDGQHLSDDHSFYDNVDVVFSYGKATHARFLALKEQENLAPDAKIYDEVEVISALCGGLGASANTLSLSRSWVDIEMKDIAAPSFQAVPKMQQDSPKGNAASPTKTSSQLGRNYPTLLKNMGGKDILKYLVQDRIISIEKQREMKEEARDRKQSLNELILYEIAGLGEPGVQSLCSALRQDDVNQDYLADMLEPKAEMPNLSPTATQAQYWQPPFNIVLLGRTGSGKSSSGNSIVGSRVFEESDMGVSETKICDNAKAFIDGYVLNVIDTPGFADTDVPHEVLVQEITRVHLLAHTGIHAIILVFRFPPRLTDEEKRAYDSLLQMFREDILKHVIILYTYGDDFEKKSERHKYSLQNYVLSDRNPKWFRDLLKHVNNRYLIFDNFTDDQFKQEAQRCQLLQKILEVMAGTQNQPYNNKYTKIASDRMNEEAELALEQDKKQMMEFATIINAADVFPEEPDMPEASPEIAPSTLLKVGPKNETKKKKKKDGKKHTHEGKDTVLSQDVRGKTVVVPGHEDDGPAGEWIECQPRAGRSNLTRAHIRPASSMPASRARKESPVQDPKDVDAHAVDKAVEGAAVAVPRDVSNQTPPLQPRGGVPVNNTVNKAVLRQKIDELLTLVKQNKGHGKAMMEMLQIEVEKDAGKDCLPSSSSVLMIDSTGEATEVSLSSVSMGDKVKVSADTFEPVFLFSHAVEDVLSTYISFTTEGGKTVALSQSHLITVIKGEKNVTVAAREITEGDKLFTVKESTGCLVPDKVVSARYVLKSGQYCPHTYSGHLIVNGVYVSCYTDKLPLRLAHGLLLPLGWLHRSCPRLFRLLCAAEETDGVPWWMSKLDDILTWWRSG